MPARISSIKDKERIQSLDILRGFALLGIALVNVFGFNASFFDFGGYYNNLQDPVQQKFYNIFIGLAADKFISIYSFLFGYGFYLQFAKYQSSGQKFNDYYKRRLFYLFLFGVFHVFFLWAGDILIMYAIAGSIMFLLRKWPAKYLLLIGVVFYFFISIWLVLSIWLPLPNGLSSTCKACLNDALLVYPNENYFECLKLRLSEYYAFRNINLVYYLTKIIGIFLFGFLASKYKLHSKIKHQKMKWVIIFLIFSFLGTILYFNYESWVTKMLPADSIYLNAIYMSAYELMNLFLSISYILLILILASLRFILLKPLAYAGRMSLTNYITQSILFSIIFYGWGFGKFGMKEPTIFIWYTAGIFIFQIIFSYSWLKVNKQGPLEWLWRKLSYKT